MARIRIVIETDGAAFEDDYRGEVARILQDIAERVSDRPETVVNLYDINGNHCGTACIEGD